ncbi:hypothetical protein [Geobacter sp. DSM 9736]|uniref:hypothetical protein n=1 Tax=Geobacter sp. DSM 9736 TaxID=1277350 RepID=UPI000B500A7F|nr:hypothetical protein [Geobacter sp. DSM 9736]SNB45613.1 hypothetical protein SAMN06269301_1038 [Geobacter sp. DSM 9736]
MKPMILLLLLLLNIGCARLQVIPEPGDGAVLNQAENSQSITRDGITMTAKNADINMFSYNLEGTVSAFSVVIDNGTEAEVAFSADSFLLLDNDNRQYYPLTPEKVKEILSRDSYYLIPYPYVGFYYLEDYERSSFYNRFNSSQPYFYEIYPQDIYTRALPSGTIIPKAKVSGLLYFRIDLNEKKSVKLLAYKPGTPKSAPPDFVFPFRVTK